jgi:hypothetical protein
VTDHSFPCQNPVCEAILVVTSLSHGLAWPWWMDVLCLFIFLH